MSAAEPASSGGGGKVVAVAVSGRRSRRALRWAAENLIPDASRVVLLHVIPPVSFIPNPSGEQTPIEQVGRDALEMYLEDRRKEAKDGLASFRRLCRTKKEVEMLVLDGEDAALAILEYLCISGTKNLVLGCPSLSWLARIIKGHDVPTTLLNAAPDSCNIFLVSRHKLVIKFANKSSSAGFSPIMHIRRVGNRILTPRERSLIFDEQASKSSSSSSEHDDSAVETTLEYGQIESVDSNSDHFGSSLRESHGSCKAIVMPSIWEEQQELDQVNIHRNQREIQRSVTHNLVFNENTAPAASHYRNKSEDLEEVEKLRMELHKTLSLYNRACNDLIYAKKKVQVLSAECSEEARKVRAALEREKVMRKIAAEEKARHLEAIKEIEEARNLLAKEALERHIAEINAMKESSEKRKIADALFSSDRRCKRYTSDEIKAATNNFSSDNIIGEGAYGNVYKCNLDHMPVAIKVLRRDSYDTKMNEQFLREVEVLTQLHHPNMVLLLGLCPESGCLVYDYLENGSLEDRLFCKNGSRPLPWTTRVRIIFEVACGLAFLHSSKPEPIVHCDLKPGNILLDRNYVSKIGDVGLARLMKDVVPDGITEYRDTLIAGTPHYMDPEYQRTGVIRPKSDLYAFGIIVLQLLTARHPLGLLVAVENALDRGSLADILDKSVTGWPLVESKKLAQIALKCASLRCRDRPDLESEVIPEIEKTIEALDARFKIKQSDVCAPSHFFCPILQEVMSDPYIAADGFTYEHRAIKAWLAKHKVSPVTKLRLQHTHIIPNHTMRSAIQEWKIQTENSAE